MGAARKRKQLGLPTPSPPVRVREITLEVPVALADELKNLCPRHFTLREWLVGALAVFVAQVKSQKEQEEQKNRLIVPAATMPRLPSPGALLGGRG